MPIINQPSLFPRNPLDPGQPDISGSAIGLGDVNPSLFLSPAKSAGFIWGVGPTFTLPTATDPRLGDRNYSMGPAAVALTMQGPWVAGALADHQWSFAGWGPKDTNQTIIQPFVNYNLGDGWALKSAPIMTADWENKHGHEWTVPMGMGVSKLFRLGKLPINTSVEGLLQRRDAEQVLLRLAAARPGSVPAAHLQVTRRLAAQAVRPRPNRRGTQSQLLP